MGGNLDKGNYSSIGLSFPFGYIERDKDGFNAGVNLSASTPWSGPYGETGAMLSFHGMDITNHLLELVLMMKLVFLQNIWDLEFIVLLEIVRIQEKNQILLKLDMIKQILLIFHTLKIRLKKL